MMRNFPVFLDVDGRRVIVVGGGETAAQKARLVRKTSATLVLIAPELDAELQALVDAGNAVHDRGPITTDTFRDAALVFVATGCPATDACCHALAKAAGALVNTVDQPHLCDAYTPSIVDRSPVVVAIGTEGAAPVLGRQIKTAVEKMLDPALGRYVGLAGQLRDAVARNVPKPDRRAFWQWAFSGAPWQAHKRGAEREAARLLKAAVAAGGVPDRDDQDGRITFIGAGPGARDLLTLRAVERLQDADVIFYDRLVDPDVLELARRDARRVFVGKTVGAHAWPQDRINDLIVAEAQKGEKVVRLKSGDPAIFGRLGEELGAARAKGIPVEVVPGVTAASAAAAVLEQPLTDRGTTDTLVFSTGTCRDGDLPPDWSAYARPGTTVALYMAVRNAADVQKSMQDAGLPGHTRVQIVAAASTPGQKTCETVLESLADTLRDNAIESPAIILVTVPKTHQISSHANVIGA